MGLNFQLADLLWLSALQGFDYCEKYIKNNQCVQESWLFKTLDMATEYDPQFEAGMYQSGGLALSVIISDYVGASQIFNKGVVNNPKNWQLLYAAAYHAYFEEKNKLKAADLYFRAAKNGAPDWVHVMAGRLAAEGGEYEYAEKILQTMIETNQDEKYVSRLKEKLQALKKQAP